MSKILEICNLTKVYKRDNNGIQGVENVNLGIDNGAILALIGENGAGKSTLIKMIVSILKPDSGKILINGIEVNKNSNVTIKKIIGYSSETPFFYTKLTGYEIATFIGEMYGCQLHNNDELSFISLAKKLKLEQHLNKLVNTYSNGTLRKLSICMAIAFNQSLIILDEPTNGLDPDSYLQLRDILEIAKAKNKAVLLSTHQLSMAEKLADVIAICKKGKIHCFDYTLNSPPVEELYAKFTS